MSSTLRFWDSPSYEGGQMDNYLTKAKTELQTWKLAMGKRPGLMNQFTKGLQKKANNLIPDKVHQMITATIRTTVQTVLSGAEFITGQPLGQNMDLALREQLVQEKLKFYKKAAAAGGAGTGAGGILLGLTDFPLLLSFKFKFLFDAATIYGFDVRDYKERLYILNLFQLTFSSDERRVEVFQHILNWEDTVKNLPPNLNDLDWHTFQQEYRDYIDLAKMLQLVPGIGAFVGAYANYRLMNKLGETAINGYRLRILEK